MPMCLRCQPQEKESYCIAPLCRPSGRVRPNKGGLAAVSFLTTIDPLLRASEQSEKPICRSKQVGRRICQQRENKPPIASAALAARIIVGTPLSFIVV